jgi:hypothetical protein
VGLHRFWFSFRLPPFAEKQPSSWRELRLGCGVTAYDEADARQIIERLLLESDGWPEVKSVTVDVDIRKLDQGHVIPNMEPPNWRGIWFPRGFTRVYD